MRPLLKKKIKKKVGGKEIVIGFTSYGNSHLYSDTFDRARGFKKEDLKDLDKALKNSTYVKSAPLSKPRKDNISKFYYFKDKDKELYYNVAEERRGRRVSRYLFSATNQIRKEEKPNDRFG